jgi:aspartyl-tRNA(Asn)/glutamyl-tRNA(Gln) amidotransferase subunit C
MIEVTEVEKLAELARLNISEEEKKELAKEIGSILTYVDQIKKAHLDIDETPRVGQIHNVFREDIVHTTSAEDRETLLAEAPGREGDFIAVKKIIEQD